MSRPRREVVHPDSKGSPKRSKAWRMGWNEAERDLEACYDGITSDLTAADRKPKKRVLEYWAGYAERLVGRAETIRNLIQQRHR